MRKPLLALGLMCSTACGWADVQYVTTMKGASGANGQSVHHYVKGNKMLTDLGPVETLIDYDAQTVTNIDKQRRTYSVTSLGDLGKDSSPAAAGVKAEVKDTGEVKTINGYKSHKMMLTMDTGGMKMQTEMWVSSDVPGAGEMKALYQRLSDRGIFNRMNNGGSPMVRAMAEMQKEYAKINGIPVMEITRITMGPESKAQEEAMQKSRAQLEEMAKKGGPQADQIKKMLAQMPPPGAPQEIQQESSGFSTATIPASMFAIPAGFQKTDMGMGMGAQPRGPAPKH